MARALRVSLAELTEELERLKIRRRAFALTRGSDHELPRASAVAGVRGGPIGGSAAVEPRPCIREAGACAGDEGNAALAAAAKIEQRVIAARRRSAPRIDPAPGRRLFERLRSDAAATF